MDTNTTPQYLPTLSAGRHTSPEKGACFMEYASLLAGERWSDHPACTDPVLAALARCVNDAVSDETRSGLAIEVPRVIGLLGGEELSLLVGLRAAASALPIAAEHHQRALAVAAIGMLGALERRGVTDAPAIEAARLALRDVPAADEWARAFLEKVGKSAMDLVVTGCTQAVRTAALAVSEALVPDPEPRLAAMLRTAIEDAEGLVGRTERVAEPDLIRVGALLARA